MVTTHLTYALPGKRRKKRILRIPESHSLYVCPQSCTRRQALRALRNGEADQMSFLQLAEADLVSGDYEGQVADAVSALLDALPQRPRVLQLYVNCVDDFVGTDGETLVAGLREQFPGVRFTLQHINPIAVDVNSEFAGKMHRGLYGLLEQPEQQDAGVNLLGSFEPLPAETELHDALAAAGAGPERHIVSCKTFDDYLAMAASCMNVCTSRMGEGVSQDMANVFGMQRMDWRATYSLDAVAAKYAELAEMLAATGRFAGEAQDIATAMQPVLEPAREQAQAAVRRALAAVGSVPVAVDSAATFAPYDLAREMREYGFNVQVCFALHMKQGDLEARQALTERFPQVRIVENAGVDALRAVDVGSECLAVGEDAAQLTGARWSVDLYHDEGYFGYQGITRLMNQITAAMQGAPAALSSPSVGAFSRAPENGSREFRGSDAAEGRAAHDPAQLQEGR